MGDPGARPSADDVKLTYAARMMLVTAALFVLAGAVRLISGTSPVLGVAFVIVGLVTAGLTRVLLSRLGPGRSQT